MVCERPRCTMWTNEWYRKTCSTYLVRRLLVVLLPSSPSPSSLSDTTEEYVACCLCTREQVIDSLRHTPILLRILLWCALSLFLYSFLFSSFEHFSQSQSRCASRSRCICATVCISFDFFSFASQFECNRAQLFDVISSFFFRCLFYLFLIRSVGRSYTPSV